MTRKQPRKLTVERLRELLLYDPDTGIFIWIKAPKRKPTWIGRTAGCLQNVGYLHIQIDGERYLSHILAWLYMTGKWPKEEIDHKDLNKTNNKWENLREATHTQNQYNRKRNKNNTSGYKGVNRSQGKWRAQSAGITIGLFPTAEEAFSAYKKYITENHSEFARSG